MNTIAQRSKQLIFPTPLYIIDFNDTSFCDETIVNLKWLQDNNLGVGDDLCWTSIDTLHKRNEFQKIQSIILKEIEQVFNDVGLIRETQYISCMWANISKAINRHALHPHANSFFSGVIYLNTPINPGNIGFKDPRPAAEVLTFDYIESSIFSQRTIEIEPVKGRMIVFPSWLYHGTKRGFFPNDEERISLSFNILPKVKVQDFTRKIEL